MNYSEACNNSLAFLFLDPKFTESLLRQVKRLELINLRIVLIAGRDGYEYSNYGSTIHHESQHAFNGDEWIRFLNYLAWKRVIFED